MSNAPVPKVSVATISAALTSFLVWVASTYLFPGTDTPAAVVGLLAVLVPAAVTFAAGYMAPRERRAVHRADSAE